MRVLGLIPARGGSKGVPRKNAKDLAGKPLVAWTVECALASRRLDRVVLSTDDDEIAEIGSRWGVEVPFRRPAAIAADATPMIDVVVHALDALESMDEPFDAVCLLQPTSPLRTPDDVDAAISLLESSGADCVFSTLEVPTEHHPDWVFVVDESSNLRLANGEVEPIARRQDLRPAVYREGSIYVSRSEVIRTKRFLYGEQVRGLPIDPARSVNIDTVEDWNLAESMLDVPS